jgi:hypothetical protein
MNDKHDKNEMIPLTGMDYLWIIGVSVFILLVYAAIIWGFVAERQS